MIALQKSFSASPMYILKFTCDRFTQINTDDALVVTTIIFDGMESGPRKERFRVHWMQCKMNRGNVLDYLRATWLCRQSSALCHVYHNGQHWPMADQTIRHLDNGDRIRLQVRTTGPIVGVRWSTRSELSAIAGCMLLHQHPRTKAMDDLKPLRLH